MPVGAVASAGARAPASTKTTEAARTFRARRRRRSRYPPQKRVLKRAGGAVDTRRVAARTVGIISLLAALAIGGYVVTRATDGTQRDSQTADRAEERAASGAAATNFQAVVPILEQHRAENGTYADATLEPGYGVALMRADTASYCLQAGTGTNVQHLAGPNGSPAPGAC